MAAAELPMNEEADDEPVRRMDPEIRVMNQIQKLLNDLPVPARGRVMRYLGDRAFTETPSATAFPMKAG